MEDTSSVLRRRWVAAVVALLAVVAAAGVVVQRTPAVWSYSSTVLLLPPEVSRVANEDGPDYTRGNPLFYLGSVTETRDILVGVMMAKDAAEEVAEEFPGITYSATPDVLGSAPVVVLTVQGSDRVVAGEAVTAITDSVPRHLNEIQGGLEIKKGARITAYTLTRQASPTASHKDRIRAGVMVGGALGLLALFAIGAGDALLQSRRRTRPGTSTEEVAVEESEPLPEPEPVMAGEAPPVAQVEKELVAEPGAGGRWSNSRRRR